MPHDLPTLPPARSGGDSRPASTGPVSGGGFGPREGRADTKLVTLQAGGDSYTWAAARTGSQHAAWVAQTYRATTVGSATVYDLTVTP